MSTRANMSTSTAILLGSGLLAVAVLVGLARLQPAPDSSPLPVVSPVAAPVQSAPVLAREVVTQHASEALTYQRAALRGRCPVPPGERHLFVLNVTFDGQGVEVMRGIHEDRQNPKSSLAQCIAGVLTPIRVPAPGAVIMVEVPLSLP